jgi:predicted Zn-dependent protease
MDSRYSVPVAGPERDKSSARPGCMVDAAMQVALAGNVAGALTEVGFAAIFNRQLAEAQTIFTALRSFRPDCDFPIMGLALIAVQSGQMQGAVNLIQEGLVKFPESANLKSLFVLALMLSGRRKESSDLLQSVASTVKEPLILAFCQALRDEMARRTSPAACDWKRASDGL